MIGEIRKICTPFYDMKSQTTKFKFRPALILAQADDSDYVVLPISSVSIRKNLDTSYDIEIDPKKYPKLNLNKLSYIRTHKQTTMNKAEILGLISNLKQGYEDLYLQVLEKRDEFNADITSRSL